METAGTNIRSRRELRISCSLIIWVRLVMRPLGGEGEEGTARRAMGEMNTWI